MSHIIEDVRKDLKTAMKNREALRLGVIRDIIKCCKEQEINQQASLTDNDAILVIDKLVKQTHESITDYRNAKRDDLVAQESIKLEILNSYLPAMPSEAEINRIIEQVLESNPSATISDLGKIMGQLKPKLPDRTDFKHVTSYIKKKLAK